MARKKEKIEENKTSRSSNLTKNDENSSKMSSERPKKAPKKAITKAKMAEKAENFETIDNHGIGLISTELQIEKHKNKSDAEIEGETYAELIKCSKNNEVLWGQVASVDRTRNLNNRFIISIIYKDTKISIPDNLYFEDSYDFGNNYKNSLDEAQRMEFRMKIANLQLGATVCFCIEKVAKTPINEGYLNGETYLTVIGNRNKAMAILRDIYFYHKGRTKSADMPPRTIEVGDIIKNANVIAVREDSIIVETAGVETRIDAYNVNTEYVTNCKDYFKPGDFIDVRVRKVYINPDGVYLTLSGRLNNSSKLVYTMHVGDVVLGTVDKYNGLKKAYTVVLKNGVTASCPAYSVRDRIPLVIGDQVKVYITNIYLDAGFVAGQASKV